MRQQRADDAVGRLFARRQLLHEAAHLIRMVVGQLPVEVLVERAHVPVVPQAVVALRRRYRNVVDDEQLRKLAARILPE